MFIQLRYYGSSKILEKDSKLLFFTNKAAVSLSISHNGNLCLVSSYRKGLFLPLTEDNKARAVHKKKPQGGRVKTE